MKRFFYLIAFLTLANYQIHAQSSQSSSHGKSKPKAAEKQETFSLDLPLNNSIDLDRGFYINPVPDINNSFLIALNDYTNATLLYLRYLLYKEKDDSDRGLQLLFEADSLYKNVSEKFIMIDFN